MDAVPYIPHSDQPSAPCTDFYLHLVISILLMSHDRCSSHISSLAPSLQLISPLFIPFCLCTVKFYVLSVVYMYCLCLWDCHYTFTVTLLLFAILYILHIHLLCMLFPLF